MRTVRRFVALGLALSLSSGCAMLFNRPAKEAIIAVSAEDMSGLTNDQIETRITERETRKVTTVTGTYVQIPLDKRYAYDLTVAAPGHQTASFVVDKAFSQWVMGDLALLVVVPAISALVGSAASVNSPLPYGVGSLIGVGIGELIALGVVVTDLATGAAVEHQPMLASVTLPADRYSGAFEVELEDVLRTIEGRDAKVAHVPVPLSPAQVRQLLFQDAAIQVQWALRPNGLNLVLENRSDRSIKVYWDDAAYVDPSGFSHRLIRHGARLSDKDHAQVPSVIPAKARLDDLLAPAESFGRGDGPWGDDGLLPNVTNRIKADLDEVAAPFIGQTIKVVLPIRIQGVVSDYTFRFRIKGVSVKPLS
jgi:hypothetical protein